MEKKLITAIPNSFVPYIQSTLEQILDDLIEMATPVIERKVTEMIEHEIANHDVEEVVRNAVENVNIEREVEEAIESADIDSQVKSAIEEEFEEWDMGEAIEEKIEEIVRKQLKKIFSKVAINS